MRRMTPQNRLLEKKIYDKPNATSSALTDCHERQVSVYQQLE
jgi:hypothetical protein